MRYLILILVLFMAGCSTMPTSARLEAIKARLESYLRAEVKEASFEYGSAAFIRIFKEEGELELWLQMTGSQQYALYKTYPICKFSGLLGPKLQEGDKQAPEGFYTVGANQMNPWSQYHLSFNLGFPNEYDQAMGRTGSALMVHGGCDSIGCYAMEDHQMEDIYLLTEVSIENGHNVPVHIFPFRMSPEKILTRRDSDWLEFWLNLKEGYDIFEITKIPPPVSVAYGQDSAKYVFHTPIAENTNANINSPMLNFGLF